MHYLLKTILSATLVMASLGNFATAKDNQIFDFTRFISERTPASNEASKSTTDGAINLAPAFYFDPNGVAQPILADNESNKYSDVSFGRDTNSSADQTQTLLLQEDIKNRHVFPVRSCPSSPLASDQIASLVNAAARRHGVAPEFATAIVWAESRFDRIRNSPKGARGPMQLMPDTAGDLGVTDVCDPESNIDGGVRYLRTLLDEFQNPLLAAAAYNAGPQAVRDHDGIPPYTETISYLAEILNFQLGLRSPESRTASSKSDQQPADNGVIGGVSAGRFVAGVMKF
jgi:hypothetical protein